MTVENQKLLLEQARSAIKGALLVQEDDEKQKERKEQTTSTPLPTHLPDNLSQPGAAFVTLTLDGSLRGCIGSISAHQPLIDDVIQNSKSAAFKDPRFPPLTSKELETVIIEISIMTPFIPLSYNTVEELLKVLESRKPGVIITKGFKRALFLPQVWEQLPEPGQFLSHLCSKAGMISNEWEEGELKIETNSVFKFKE